MQGKEASYYYKSNKVELYVVYNTISVAAKIAKVLTNTIR